MSTRTITEAPVLHPTMEEFEDFESYMHAIHEVYP